MSAAALETGNYFTPALGSDSGAMILSAAVAALRISSSGSPLMISSRPDTAVFTSGWSMPSSPSASTAP